MSSRVPESLDPDKLLLDLGWSDTPSARPAAGASRRSRPARHYCSFCWTAIPDGDVECASCGRSLEEILAAAGAPGSGAGWKPTRLGGASTVPKRERVARVVTLTADPAADRPLRAPARQAMHPAATVLLVAALLAASTMTGAYLGQLSVERGAADGAPPTVPKPRATPASSGSAAPIEWNNPHSELRLELVSSKGNVVAASDSETSTVPNLDPGEYRLRTSAIEGEWHPVERAVTVRAGETLKLAPSPESVAEYFTFRGWQLRNAGKQEEAKEAWRTAIQAAPALPEPRLQLAESLITENRYSDAGAELRAVLDVSPDDPRAIRLLRRIREQSTR